MSREMLVALLEREARRTFGLYVGAWRCVQKPSRSPSGKERGE